MIRLPVIPRKSHYMLVMFTTQQFLKVKGCQLGGLP